ncbi:MAG: 50S ribosomal protein L30e [Candidatus Altiarchaeales archaeon]|nr:MAG: 50S ribosomal protein L30e [Candidatus Altiarchaeales archaeon]
MKDVKSGIENVVKKGKIVIGSKNVVSALLNDNPKLVIISSNCPTEIKEDIIYYSRLSEIPYRIIDDNSIELGSICGKPFPIAVMAVMDVDDKDILKKLK